MNVISRDKNKLIPAVFVHIQKTAGSSIVELVHKNYGQSFISHGDYVGNKPEQYQDTSFVSGHFGYEFARTLIPERYSFTFLRQPVERVVSFYSFCKRQSPDENQMCKSANELNLVDFLRLSLERGFLKTAVCNNQAWQLAHGYGHGTNRNYYSFEDQEMLDLASNHLEKFSHVGFTETFEADRDIILNNLESPLPKENAITNSSVDKLPVEDLPDSTLELLREVTSLDQIIYDQAWSNR